MSGNTNITAIEALSNNVMETRFEDIDSKTLNMAKRHITDVFGCSIGGAYAACKGLGRQRRGINNRTWR